MSFASINTARMQAALFFARKRNSLRRTNGLIVTADTLPELATLVDTDTPSDGFTSGTYSSSAGDIDTETAIYYVNGSRVASSYDLSENDEVYVQEIVVDDQGNRRSFRTASQIVTGA